MKEFKFKVKEALTVDIPGVDFYSATIEVPMDENEYGSSGKTAILAAVGGSISAVILENFIKALWMHKTLPQFKAIDFAQVEWK